MRIKLVGLLLLMTILSTFTQAKDPNILSYIDRGVKYYPKYVKRGLTKITKASWYGKPFHGRLTANGERYNMYAMTAAHKTYAMGTRLKITNLSNRKSVRVRINDRGPFYSSRSIDLSYGAARKIGLVHKGVGRVKIEVLSSKKASKKRHHKRLKSHDSKKKPRVTSKRKSLKKKSKKRVNSVKKHKVPNKKVHKKHLQVKRTKKIQVASFSNKKLAHNFKKKLKLANVTIVHGYIKATKTKTYRVIVNCTKKEAKKLLNSKKFTGAYLLS